MLLMRCTGRQSDCLQESCCFSNCCSRLCLALLVTLRASTVFRCAPGMAAKSYFYALLIPNSSNSTSSDGLLLQPSSLQAYMAFAEAIHHALDLPATYPFSKINVWLAEPDGLPAAQRRLLSEQQQPNTSTSTNTSMTRNMFVWGFQLLPGADLPDAAAIDAAVRAEDGTTVLLQLVVVGCVDASVLWQMSGGFTADEQGGLQAPTSNITGVSLLVSLLHIRCEQVIASVQRSELHAPLREEKPFRSQDEAF